MGICVPDTVLADADVAEKLFKHFKSQPALMADQLTKEIIM